MAWITKNSAGTVVEKRSQPYLTVAMQADLTNRLLPRFETTHAALLPALHMIQHEYGWIPAQAMLEIAEFLKLDPSQVIDTASFYEEYWLKPKGEHLISVCRSIACEACDYRAITQVCKDKLGIEVGETTDDGKFTLVEVECLGSCDSAPVALVGEKLHEWLTPETIANAIDDIKSGKTGTKHGGHAH